MRHRRKKKQHDLHGNAGPEAEKGSAGGSAGEHKAHRGGLHSHFLIGLAILFFCSLAEYFIGETGPGHDMHLLAYQWLHNHIRVSEASTNLPVVLVDISTIRPGRADGYTPLGELRRLIDRLTNAEPAAIGVDIDMSPETNGEINPELPGFAKHCLGIARSGTPVFLGVHRMASAGPEAWLNGAEYSSLAAGISRSVGLVWKMNYAYEFEGEGDKRRELPSLSRALAEAYWLAHRDDAALDTPRALELVAHRISESEVGGGGRIRAKEFLMDYSQREQIEKELLTDAAVLDPANNRWRGKVRGKIALLGDALHPTDPANIPPMGSDPKPGVQVQACAVYTLTKAPMYELKWWVGLGTSFFMSLFALWLVETICERVALEDEDASVPLNIVLSAVMILLVCAGAALGVKYFRVVWFEVFVVVMVLIAHCFLEIFATTSGRLFSRSGGLSGSKVSPRRQGNE
jgi:CHASE2 domain-containing sensor protein